MGICNWDEYKHQRMSIKDEKIEFLLFLKSETAHKKVVLQL
jgi:hypothetical protein